MTHMPPILVITFLSPPHVLFRSFLLFDAIILSYWFESIPDVSCVRLVLSGPYKNIQLCMIQTAQSGSVYVCQPLRFLCGVDKRRNRSDCLLGLASAIPMAKTCCQLDFEIYLFAKKDNFILYQ